MSKRKKTVEIGQERKKRKWTTRLALWSIGGCGFLMICSLIGQAVGVFPTTEEMDVTRTVDAQIALATDDALSGMTAVAQADINATLTAMPTATPSETPSPTLTPTEGPSPTATITVTPEPSATITPTPQPSATYTESPEDRTMSALEAAYLDISGVETLPVVSASPMRTGGWIVYVEATVAPGSMTTQTANAMRQATYSVLTAAQVEFNVIMADGQNTPTDYSWDNGSDEWRVTVLTGMSPQVAATPAANPTAAPVAGPSIWVNNGNVRARACPQLDCDIVEVFSAGQELASYARVDGATVAGNSTWWHAEYQGREVYVHSSLISTSPISAAAPAAPAEGQAPSVATQPAPGASVQRPGNCSTAVAMGLTAEQAAQWSNLDRDNDGVACYGD